MEKKKVVIAGAGIGGLTTALALHTKGYDVQVYESARELRPLGVGINLLPHAVRVLINLGLEEEMERMAVATRELVYHNKFGQRIWQEPRGKFAGYRWPQFSVHRGRFQMILLEAVKRELGKECIHTGHTLQQFSGNDNGVEATFIHKDRNEVIATAKGDILIGADGIHSAVRKHFYPDEGLPKFSGIILHRGTTRTKPFLTGSSMIMAGSAEKKFVAYPIMPGTDKEGNQLINWVADLKLGPEGNIMPQDWNRKADREKLLQEFDAWHFDWLDVPSLISEADDIYEFPMSDRDPLTRWSFGRITLLGDAAHPMYPIGSNGASQAILDAECLTESLLGNDDPILALQKYEAIRLPATASIVLQNRQMGPEQVMQIVEERAPGGFSNLDDVISQDELEAIAALYKKVAGFEREALNQKY